MKSVWSFSAAICAAGAMVLSGCGTEEVAPEKKSDSDSTSMNVETRADELAEAAGSAEESESLESEGPGEITMADFEGFLPSDPIESVELTVSKEAASMGPMSGKSKVKLSDFAFETPVRLKGGGEYVKVDAPGYACPTMADVDEDGKLDLVVGQFASGKMRMFRNVSEKSNLPEFAAETWIKSGDEAAEVPGVW